MDLLDLCRGGADDSTVLAWLDALTPEQREAQAALARSLQVTSTRHMDDDDLTVTFLALGGTAKETHEKICWQRPPTRRDSLVSELLARRSDAWCAAFVKTATTSRFGQMWWLVRRLVREGRVPRPQGNYLVQMLGLVPRHHGEDHGAKLAAALRDDSGLLEVELWELLATEGLVRLIGAEWHAALLELARTGYRDQLADAALDGLTRDWPPVDQKPLLDLLAALTLTEDELARRVGTLLRLTGSEHGPVVRWALGALMSLHQAGRIPGEDVLAVTAPLRRRDKQSAMAHLKLLEQVVRREPSYAPGVWSVARVGLEHENADVRDRAAKLTLDGRITDPEPLSVVDVDPTPQPRPTPPAFEPLSTVDDLVELLVGLLAGPGSALDSERVFEAAVRMRHDVTESGRRALAQAADRLQWNSRPGIGAGVVARELSEPPERLLEWDAQVYDTDRHDPDFSGRSLEKMVDQRLWHLRFAMRSKASVLLSAPSSADGSLALDALEERLRLTSGEPALRADVGLAAFRIAPSEYADVARLRFSTIGSAIADDVERIANHMHTWRPVAVDYRRWRATSTTPSGSHDHVVWEDATPEAEPATEFVGTVLDRRRMPDRGVGEILTASTTALWPLMLPHRRELLAAHAHPQLVGGLLPESPEQVQVVLGLGGGAAVAGRVTSSALAHGLSAEHAPTRLAAVDALVDLATFGLLPGALLGEEVARMLDSPYVVGSRIAKGLREAGAALGPLGGPLLDAHLTLMPAILDRRDAHLFAVTTADLAVALGRRVFLPEPLRALAAGPAKSAVARALRRVPV